MTDTKTLIAHLSSAPTPQKPLRSPRYWATWLLLVLACYGVGTQLFLGIRPDIAVRITDPFFVLELLILFALLITSTTASVVAMAPDAYQKSKLLGLPYLLLAVLVGMILCHLLMPEIATLDTEIHRGECALCIAAVAIIPSALLFAVLRKGATIHPLQAGSFIVLAASAIGCLTLRLSESQDAILHLGLWHYLPTLLFAALGACLGRWLLKW